MPASGTGPGSCSTACGPIDPRSPPPTLPAPYGWQSRTIRPYGRAARGRQPELGRELAGRGVLPQKQEGWACAKSGTEVPLILGTGLMEMVISGLSCVEHTHGGA